MWRCPNCETNNEGGKCPLCGTLKPVSVSYAPPEEHIESKPDFGYSGSGDVYGRREAKAAFGVIGKKEDEFRSRDELLDTVKNTGWIFMPEEKNEDKIWLYIALGVVFFVIVVLLIAVAVNS